MVTEHLAGLRQNRVTLAQAGSLPSDRPTEERGSIPCRSTTTGY